MSVTTDVVTGIETYRSQARDKARTRYLALIGKAQLTTTETEELARLADTLKRSSADVRGDIQRLAEEAKSKAEAETIQTITAELAEAQAKADALLTKLNKRRSELDAEEQDATGRVEFLKHRLKTARDSQRRLDDIQREWRKAFGEQIAEPVLQTTRANGDPYEMQPFGR